MRHSVIRTLTGLLACMMLAGCGAQGEAYQPRSTPASQSVIYIYRPYKLLTSQSIPMVTCGHESIELEPGEAGCVLAKRDLLVKAIQALLETAVKFSKAGQVVRLNCEAARDGVQVFIRSCGRIPEFAIANFFQVLSIGDAITPGGDLGLGPPVSQRILALFGGSITVENLEPSGIQLRVVLRAAYSPASSL